MKEREAFLRAILANPADDTVRLAFADWLDENDEPDRAEFIRLQIKRARAERKGKSPQLSPREKTLLSRHKANWFGPLASLKTHQGLEYTLRRGFIESVVIYGRHINEHAEVFRTSCPALTQLDVIGVRGFGEQIANGLPGGIRTLRLDDWPFPDDAKSIAESPHLEHLESLSLWLGSQHDEAVCRAIGASRALPALQRVELVQLNGGIDAGSEAARLDARADRLATILNTKRKSKVATVCRPPSELLPLAPSVGWNLHAGTVPDGRQVLIHARLINNEGDCILFYFDDAGKLLSGELIEITGILLQTPDYRGYKEKEFCAFLAKRIGFRPGMIRVREFEGSAVIADCWIRLSKFDSYASYFIGCADRERPDYYSSREEQLERVRYFYRGGHFCITHGGDGDAEAFVGPAGTTHTT